MDDAPLVDVGQSIHNVLGPDLQFFFFNWLVFNVNFLAQVIGPEACILHEQTELVGSLRVVEALYYVGVVHLHVDGALSFGKLNGQVRSLYFVLLCCL